MNSIELIEGFTKIERLLSDPVILKAAQDELEADIQVHAATARQHMEEYKSYQMPIHNEDGNVNGNALNRRGRPSRTSIGRMSFGGLLGGAGRLFSLRQPSVVPCQDCQHYQSIGRTLMVST